MNTAVRAVLSASAEGTAALTVGGIAPVSVQTMLNVPTDDLGACLFSSAAASRLRVRR